MVVAGLSTAAATAAVVADAPTPAAIPAPPFAAPASFTRPATPLLTVVSDTSHPVVVTTTTATSWGEVDRVAGEGPLSSFAQGATWYVTYGRDGASARYLLSFRQSRPGVRWVLDLDALATAPAAAADRELTYAQVTWAREADGILYVQNAHSTYAASSQSRNAAITAIDLRTRKVLWRSPSLVANAQTFVLAPGSRIVTGYGFTKEPDYVYVLDRATGKVLDRLPVRDAPERITRRGADEIRVQTYTRTYVLRLRG